MSSGVREVRAEREGSVRRSRLITSMHFCRGIDGKRAVASKEVRISLARSRISFANLINSCEFLQA